MSIEEAERWLRPKPGIIIFIYEPILLFAFIFTSLTSLSQIPKQVRTFIAFATWNIICVPAVVRVIIQGNHITVYATKN